MKLYKYLINVKATYGCKSNACLLAGNKKEALKFCKDFDGLKIINRLKGAQDITFTDSIDEIMKKQKEILQNGLANKTVEIIKE